MGGMQVLQWAADYPDKLFSAAASSPRPRATRPRTSPSTRWAARRSWPIPTGRAGAYARAGVAPGEGPGRGARWPPTSPICPSRPCSGSSAASCSATACRGASTPTSRWRAICATRAPASSTGSTPTRYLYITRAHGLFRPGRQPRRGAGPGLRRRAPRAASACCRFTSDWLYPTAENRHIVRALNAAGCRASLRRDRERQGPRRLPAGRAGDGRGAAGLPELGGRRSGAWREHDPRRLRRDPRASSAPARGCWTSAAARACCWSC